MSSHNFVHLHSHTDYSILDANNRIKDYVARVKELGMTAAAITDHGVMYGVIDFYDACIAAGINPIIGCEVYVAGGSRFDKRLDDDGERYYHFILLAENNEGYQNLSKIVTAGFTDGMYYGRPRVDDELMAKYHKGIIACSACLAGRIPRLLIRGKYEEAKEKALFYENMFGKGNFFLEIQDHGIRDEQYVCQEMVKLSSETGIPLVATNDCHYTTKEDADAHAVELMMRDKITVNDKSNDYGNGQLYVKSPDEMYELFKYAPEALENTVKIAERCHVTFKYHETKQPKGPHPDGMTSWEYLNQLVDEGLKKRYPNDDGTMRKQADYELSVIHKMGYVDYFLIVWDYVNWSRDNGVMVGPGRGSAAGSVVTYCIGITDIEPHKYGLYFERFLNPERVSMPDIDVDFEWKNRYRTIEHVREQYGKDCVCQIITFGTLAAKKAVQSVGKVYGYPVSYYCGLAKLIPNKPGTTLKSALKDAPDFAKAYQTDKDAKKIIDMAMRMEGLPCNTSKHAAGVIIADRPVVDYIPLSVNPDGTLVSEFDMITVEKLGLLKMDFLGLRTLTVLEDCLKNIEETTGISIDLDDIDLNDKNVYNFIGQKDTGNADVNGKKLKKTLTGVFQLESAGMQEFMADLQPDSLEDLIAGIALYRPGPMDFIPKYVAGKQNPASVTYACPQLEPILSATHGCIVYQEQVMQIFQQLAGYSLGGADLVRRAMSKKHQDEIDAQRIPFIYGDKDKGIKGCLANGISEEAANSIYDSMVDFAKYAFNKAHAACYAVISYETAWLKYYYPIEYMAAIMTTFQGTPDKLVAYAGALRMEGYTILKPDINISGHDCKPEGDNCVRLSLSMIRGVGEPVVDAIVQRQEQGKKFKSFGEFMESYLDMKADKSSIESLIKGGAFDSMPESRRAMLDHYKPLMAEIKKAAKDQINGQMNLFDMAAKEDKEALHTIKLPEEPEYDMSDILLQERETTGLFISANPLDPYKKLLATKAKSTAAGLEEDAIENYGEDAQKQVKTCIGGIVTKYKAFYTKKGQKMAFLTLEDMTGSIEVVVFPRVFADSETFLKEDALIIIDGRAEYNAEKEDVQFVASEITPFHKVPGRVIARFMDEDEYRTVKDKLAAWANEHRGNNALSILLRGKRLWRHTGLYVSRDEESIRALEEIVGPHNVAITFGT